MTIGEGLQPGCMMKTPEPERCLKSANPRGVALLQQQQEEGNAGAPHLGAWKVEGRNAKGECGSMSTARGIDPFLKAALPIRIPSATGKVSTDELQDSHPPTWGLGPTCHAS
jgi:hypothetical protein